jgi:peptidoglycan hydrolase-like protein with peptidoglycan-binding domain
LRLSNLAIAAALLAAGDLVAQDSKAKPTGTAKSTAHHPSSYQTAHQTASTRKSSQTLAATSQIAKPGARAGVKSGTKSVKKPVIAVARRSNQTQPTTDRYREIQQSLSEKGYFAGQPDGTWGADSVEALKRFQRDQNLTEDGKLGSLSLIALGLGPRRAAPAEVAVEAAPSAEKSALEKQLDKPTH